MSDARLTSRGRDLRSSLVVLNAPKTRQHQIVSREDIEITIGLIVIFATWIGSVFLFA